MVRFPNQAEPDANLAELVEGWPNLPPAAREAVMAVFRAVKL